MDINTQNSSGMMNGMPPVIKEEKKIGPIIGALVIILVIIIVALFLFGKRLNNNSVQQTQIPESEVPLRNEAGIMSTDEENTILQADLEAQLKDIDSSF